MEEIEGLVRKGRVVSVLKVRDLVDWLEKKGVRGKLERMRAYRDVIQFKWIWHVFRILQHRVYML